MSTETEVAIVGEPDDHLDSLILDNTHNTITIKEELPIFYEGFEWTTVVRTDPRVMGYVHETAKGILDGETVAEGTIEGIDSHPINGDTAVYVSPE